MPTKVGATTRTNSAAANTAFTAALPQTPTNGNTLLMGVILRRTAADPVFSAPTGWTEIARQVVAAGAGDHGLVVVCARNAGGATAPSVAYTGSSASVVIEERTDIDLTGNTADATGSAASTGTSGAITLTGALTAKGPNDFLWAVGGTTNLAATTFTWAGGQTADFAYANVNNVGIGTSVQDLATNGAKSPALNYNRTSGVAAMVAVAFRVRNQYAGMLPI